MKLLCSCVFAMISSTLFAQKTAVPDTAESGDKDVSVFQISTGYGNTANYYGQTTARKLPYTSVDLIYYSATGLWANASGRKLLNVGPASTEFNVSLGLDKEILPKLEGSISYTRFFYPKNSPLPQSVNPNAVSGGLSYDFRILSSALSGDYVFGNLEDETGGKMNDFYLSLTNSRSFDLGSLFSKKDYVAFAPSLSLISGTQLIASEVEVNQFREKKVKEKPDAHPGKGKKPFIDKDGKPVKEAFKQIKGGRPIGTSTEYVYSTEFNLLSTIFNFPFSYNRDTYTVEAAYQLSVPNRSYDGVESKNQSFFFLSFSYLFYKRK